MAEEEVDTTGGVEGDPNDLSGFEPAPQEYSAKSKKKRRDDEVGPLTITSLMDILTILLVFLLKSYSTNPVNVTQGEDMQLPDSSSLIEPEEAVPIAITQKQVLVDDQPVADLIDGAVDPSTKRDGETGYFITPLFDALSENAEKQKRIAKHNASQEFKGLALVIADRDTKYRLLNEVLYTAGQAQFSQFKFAVIKRE